MRWIPAGSAGGALRPGGVLAVDLPAGDGSWRRDDEEHENGLMDTAEVPAVPAAHGVEARVSSSFGEERLPDGLVAITGRRS